MRYYRVNFTVGFDVEDLSNYRPLNTRIRSVRSPKRGSSFRSDAVVTESWATPKWIT